MVCTNLTFITEDGEELRKCISTENVAGIVKNLEIPAHGLDVFSAIRGHQTMPAYGRVSIDCQTKTITAIDTATIETTASQELEELAASGWIIDLSRAPNSLITNRLTRQGKIKDGILCSNCKSKLENGDEK